MVEIIKKIFSFLSVMPAFTNLFRKAAETGKVSPVEALSALSSISPSTQKCANSAVNAVQNGGNLTDVAQAVMSVGEVTLPGGHKVDTRTLIPKMKEAGGFCSMLANMLEGMQKQDPHDVVNLGEKASDIKNWQEFVK